MALTFRSVSSAVTANSGDLALAEPAGAAQGDLLVASIAYRDSAAFTLPSGWAICATQQSSGNLNSDLTTSIASGVMAYIVRGSSAPDLTFTRSGGNIALGRICAYTPGSGETPVYDTGTSNTLGAASTTVTTGTFTTAEEHSLLVMAECLARNTTASRARATDPDEFIWRERADSGTTLGTDCALAVSDATRFEAGATGTLTYTAGASARHVCIAASFYTTGWTGPTIRQVTPTILHSVNAGGNTAVTASFTPAADSILIASFSCEGVTSGGTPAPTVSGGSLTWNLIDRTDDVFSTESGCLISWWASVGGSPSSMTVTADPALSNNDWAGVLIVSEVLGANTSTPIGAQIENAHITDAQSITLGATPAATSIIYQAATSADISAGAARHVVAGNEFCEYIDALSGDTLFSIGIQLRFGGTGTGVAWADVLEGATVATDDCTITHAFEIVAASSGAYTIVAAQGSYTLTGQAVALERGRLVAAVQGSIALTGQAVTLSKGRPLAIGQGAYALTGQAVVLPRNRVVAAGQGAFVLSGQTINLLRGRNVVAAQGSYALSGQAVAFLRGKAVVVGQGAYALTGQAVSLLRGRRVAADQGSYSLTGQAVAFSRGRNVVASHGTYTLSGQAVSLLRNRLVAVAQGAYVLTGQAVTLTYTPIGGFTIVAAQGSYTLTGQAVSLRRGYPLGVGQGAYALTGQSVNLKRGRVVAVTQGTYALTGQAVSLQRSRLVVAAQGSYALTGQAVGLRRGRLVAVAQGSYALTGQSITLRRTRIMGAAQGAYALSGQAVALQDGPRVAAASGSYTLTGRDVSLRRPASRLAVGVGTYALSGRAVTLTYGALNQLSIAAATGSYTLSGQSVGTYWIREDELEEARRIFVASAHERRIISAHERCIAAPERLRRFVSSGREIIG